MTLGKAHITRRFIVSRNTSDLDSQGNTASKMEPRHYSDLDSQKTSTKPVPTPTPSKVQEIKSRHFPCTSTTAVQELGSRQDQSSSKLYQFELQPPMKYIPSLVLSNSNPYKEMKSQTKSNSINWKSHSSSKRLKPNGIDDLDNIDDDSTRIYDDLDGFRNLGQTCYMAAVVQLLYHSCIRGKLLILVLNGILPK
jgi:hypothetical protein